MQKFHFQLERVLEIRRTQQKQEEAKLEKLLGAKALLENEIREAMESALRAEREVRQPGAIHPSALLAAGAFQKAVERQCAQLRAQVAEREREIAVQQKALVQARRNVMLLEKLRERKHGEWRALADRELEQLASDIAAARWPARKDVQMSPGEQSLQTSITKW